MFELVTPSDWPHYTPDQTVIYAIGDLHGHLDEHNKLYAIIENEIAKNEDKTHIIVYLGDYVDRGPDSCRLIERLITLKENSQNTQYVFLKGNHEEGFLGFMETPHAWTNWLDYGGFETAESYGIKFKEKTLIAGEYETLQRNLLQTVPQKHYEFLNLLETKTVLGDYAFVHAGIQPGVPLNHQEEKDLIFIREPFLSWPHPHEKCVVHGHTITSEPEIYMNRIGLDTGLYQNGVLTCGIFEANKISILQVKKDTP